MPNVTLPPAQRRRPVSTPAVPTAPSVNLNPTLQPSPGNPRLYPGGSPTFDEGFGTRPPVTPPPVQAPTATQGFVQAKLASPELGTSHKYAGGRYLQNNFNIPGMLALPEFSGWQQVGPDKVKGPAGSVYDVKNANGAIQWTAISGPAWDKNGVPGVNSLGVNSSMKNDGIKGNYQAANGAAAAAAKAAGSSTFGYAPSSPTAAPPSGFDEAAYLAANPDVAKAVAEGWMPSGAYHYNAWGKTDGRQLHPQMIDTGGMVAPPANGHAYGDDGMVAPPGGATGQPQDLFQDANIFTQPGQPESGAVGTGYADPNADLFVNEVLSRLQGLHTPVQDPMMQLIQKMGLERVDSLGGDPYTAGEDAALRARYMDPLTKARDAAKTQQTEQLARYGYLPSSGLFQDRMGEVDQDYQSAVGSASNDLAVRAIDEKQRRGQEQLGVLQNLLGLSNDARGESDARGREAVTTASLLPALDERRFDQTLRAEGQGAQQENSMLQLLLSLSQMNQQQGQFDSSLEQQKAQTAQQQGQFDTTMSDRRYEYDQNLANREYEFDVGGQRDQSMYDMQNSQQNSAAWGQYLGYLFQNWDGIFG